MPQDHMSFEGTRRGPVDPNGCKAASITTSERMPAITVNTSKLPCMANDYDNCGCKGKSIQAAQKEGGKTDSAAAGKVCDEGSPGAISIGGVPGPGPHALTHYSDQVTSEQSKLAAGKNKRRKFRRKKKDTCPEGLPPQEENWEDEIQPYDPEDLLQFDLQDLTLKQRDTCDLPLTANYSPAVHHPHPVRLFCYGVCTEPDQFVDAEE